MKTLFNSNCKFMSSADGSVAGLTFTEFNDVVKFLRMYNAEPETAWYNCWSHFDEGSDTIFDVAVCFTSPIELRHCINGSYSIAGAFIVAFKDTNTDTTIYVITDLVLAALGERELILTGDCCNESELRA